MRGPFGTVRDMSSKSRRKARRAKEFRRQCARARVNARALLNPGAPVRLYTRKDRQVLLSTPGKKQGYKHHKKRVARLRIRSRARLNSLLGELAEVTRSAPAVITGLDFLGSSVPFIAEGRAEAEGVELEWSFRFRYDRAFLEVGAVSDSHYGLIQSVILSSWQDGVTGEPYAGCLSDTEAVVLLGQLFAALEAPVKGSSFRERFVNTLDLIAGAGDAAAPSLFTEHKTV